MAPEGSEWVEGTGRTDARTWGNVDRQVPLTPEQQLQQNLDRVDAWNAAFEAEQEAANPYPMPPGKRDDRRRRSPMHEIRRRKNKPLLSEAEMKRLKLLSKI